MKYEKRDGIVAWNEMDTLSRPRDFYAYLLHFPQLDQKRIFPSFFATNVELLNDTNERKDILSSTKSID